MLIKENRKKKYFLSHLKFNNLKKLFKIFAILFGFGFYTYFIAIISSSATIAQFKNSPLAASLSRKGVNPFL